MFPSKHTLGRLSFLSHVLFDCTKCQPVVLADPHGGYRLTKPAAWSLCEPGRELLKGASP